MGKRIVVRRPSPRLEYGEVTYADRQPVDPARALVEWHGYVDTFRAHEWDVVEVDPADDLPDAVFVEDAVLVLDDLAVLTNPGAESRRAETASVAATLERLGLPAFRIAGPGTLEGGDVLVVDRTVYVGLSSRTNEDGVAQLRRLLTPRGYTVVTVPVRLALHLKSAVTALPDGTIIGFEPLVDDPSVFPTFLPVPEAHGAAVVALDDETVVLSAAAPETAGLLAERGLTVRQVPIAEFEKLEGCVTCLSVRVGG